MKKYEIVSFQLLLIFLEFSVESLS